MTSQRAYTPADIIWQQIPLGVKMSLGVRKQHSDNNARSLVMNVGPSNARYQVWITLNGHDMYDITLFRGKTEVWQRLDIFAEMLGEVLLRMESENWG
jgi:hypothetical protein